MSENKEDLTGFRVHTMVYQTKLTRKFANREQWQAPNPCEVRSIIPGTVIKINVKIGDVVKEGESLLVLEAMKMLNQIAMPFDGIVKEISVSEGESLPKNTLMVLIEEQN